MIEFILGKPYSKKEKYIQAQALAAAAQDPFAPVWYLVPEQYTLQMQRQLLAANHNQGLLNLEVLSFNRLVYRLQNELPVAGKLALKGSGRAALIYRLLEEGQECFPLLAAKRKSHAFLQNLVRQLTECYQYQMTPEKLRELSGQISGELLRDKTADLAGFLDAYRAALKKEYFAVEAALEEVCGLLRRFPLSDTEIFVDGFYGFVPVQLEILSILNERAKAVHIALPYAWSDKNSLNLNDLRYPAELYFDVKNSISRLRQRAAKEKIVLVEETAENIPPELLKLEAELFQSPGRPAAGESGHIHLAEAGTIEEELRYTAETILSYVYERGYRFRDIAVLTGNLEEYAEKAERIFREYRLTAFLDRKETIRRHPVMTFIESALQTARMDFRYEELMRHLKNIYIYPLAGEPGQKEALEAEISRLDIYAAEHGLRGAAAYSRLEGLSAELTEILSDLAEFSKGLKREKDFAGKLAVFQNYLDQRQVFAAIERQAEELAARADWVKASQYRQAGEKLKEYLAEMQRFMALPLNSDGAKNTASVNQQSTETGASAEQFQAAGTERQPTEITSSASAGQFKTADERAGSISLQQTADTASQTAGTLSERTESLGTETVSAASIPTKQPAAIAAELLAGKEKGQTDRQWISTDDFAALLLAGMSELEYAAAPPVPDQIVIGSLEHTRLPQTKVVFAIGLTESSVPSVQPDNGFFSDWERQALKKIGAGLAEDQRTSIFKAQLTIFMSLLSASEHLHLSYATSGGSSRAERPAQLYYQISRMFPENKIKNLTKWWQAHEQVTYPEPTLVSFMKQCHDGGTNPGFAAVYQSLKASPLGEVVKRLTQPPFQPVEKIAPVLADRLYSGQRRMSISRLESYNACPFRHFLRYGVKVREIVPYQAERVDMGIFLHKVLETFFRLSRRQKKQIFELTSEEYDQILSTAAAAALQTDRRHIFAGSARNGFLADRLTELADRAVKTVQKQMQRGEMSFYQEEIHFRPEDFAQLRFFTEDGTEFFLEGVIDRMDISRQGEIIYFSVLDYKTSEHNLDYTAIYYGLQLQLLLYLEAGREYLQNRQSLSAVPVGAAYFHLKDPIFKQTEIDGAPAEEDFLKAMRLRGVFAAESLIRLDRGAADGQPVVMNVQLKKDGIPHAGNMVLAADELKRLQDFAHHRAETAAGRIWQGDAAIRPYAYKKKTPCTYCPYAGICKFDRQERPYRYLRPKEKEDVVGEEEIF